MVVDHLTGSSLAVLLLSPLPTSGPLAGCELLVDQPVTLGLLPANPFGVAPFSVPIPATEGLAGLAVYWQAFALDSNGVTASRGLQTALGY